MQLNGLALLQKTCRLGFHEIPWQEIFGSKNCTQIEYISL